MKKLIFSIAAILALNSVCFAQQAPAAVKKETKSQVQVKEAVGKIESVIPADPAKGTKNELVVVEDSGIKITVNVASSVLIHDSAMATSSFDKLAKDEKVQVKYYVSVVGANEAISVMQLK